MSDHEIPLARPDITALEEEMVLRTLRSGRLSLGPMLESFERAVAAACDRQHAVAVSSGTSGLHLALAALGIGPGDEVITTPFSFIASANCILFVGATPVFVDIDPRSLNMDPARVEAAITPRTKAILAVETFGNPAHMAAYEAIAQRHELPLIEDCCEALGSRERGRPAGSFGRIGVFAFYPNKQITTGEGGCIVTDDRRLAQLCRSLRSQGRPVADPDEPGAAAPSPGTGSWLSHVRLGYNYRLDELSCALGVAQMRRLPEIIALRQQVARRYFHGLVENHHLVLPTVEPDSELSWFVFVVRLASGYLREDRDRIIGGLRRHEIGAADYFPCIHLQPFYRERFGFKPGDFPIAESVSQRTIAIPFYNTLTETDQDMVIRTLEHMIERENLRRPEERAL